MVAVSPGPTDGGGGNATHSLVAGLHTAEAIRPWRRYWLVSSSAGVEQLDLPAARGQEGERRVDERQATVSVDERRGRGQAGEAPARRVAALVVAAEEEARQRLREPVPVGGVGY